MKNVNKAVSAKRIENFQAEVLTNKQLKMVAGGDSKEIGLESWSWGKISGPKK